MNWINGIKLKIIWLCEYIISFIVFVISIFKKMKKPVITGMLAAGLLVTLGNKADAVPFYAARDPPTYADEYLKKEYPYEWKMIMKAHEEATTGGTSWPYEEAAISALKKRYKKDKKPETLYLLAYSIYHYAASMPSFEETEDKALEALELIEKRLKEQPNDLHAIDLKLQINYNLAGTYYRAYIGDPKYEKRKYIDSSKKDLYKKKANNCGNKWLEFFKSVKEIWPEVDIYLFRESGYNKEFLEKAKKNLMEQYEKDQKEIQDILEKLNNH